MARKEETRGFKIAKNLADSCEKIAKELGLGVSTNSFIERAMAEVVELIQEPPERRRVPKLIIQIDDVRTAEERRPVFPITPKPTTGGSNLAPLAESIGNELADNAKEPPPTEAGGQPPRTIPPAKGARDRSGGKSNSGSGHLK